MKRTLCILLVLVACLVLTSCKDNRYDDLEKRVTALEKGTDKPNTPTVNIKEPINGIENQLPDGLINGTLPPTNTPTPTPFVRCANDLTEYSMDEIYDLILYYDSICPLKGETVDKIVYKDEQHLRGWNGYYSNSTWNEETQQYEPLVNNYLWCIQYSTPFEMDNKTLSGNATYTIQLYIKNYEDAVVLFDKLSEYVISLQPTYKQNKINTDSWRCGNYKDQYGQSRFSYPDKDSGKAMEVQMGKYNNNYRFEITGGTY